MDRDRLLAEDDSEAHPEQDNNERTDLSNLLAEQDAKNSVANISDVPSFEVSSERLTSENIDVPHHKFRPARVRSSTVCPDSSSAVNPQRAVYGSLPSSTADGLLGGRRLIYCIHGKPSGCCMITEGEIINSNITMESTTVASNPSHNAEAFLDHCHTSHSKAAIDKIARRKLIIASILCVIFMVGEIIGGYLSSSLAIATDAAHLLTDFASFMISLFSLWVASRPATKRMSFGWYRAEVIGALTSVLLIWVVTGILVYLAIERIVKGEFSIDATIMLITSAVGVIVNLIMGLTLHQHGHSHGGGSSHSHASPGAVEEAQVSEQQNINVRAAYIHVLGDFIQSFGVFIAALVIYFKPTWIIVDPICTFLFSALVLATTFAIVRDTLMVLMEGMPKGVDFSEVMNTFLQIEGVVRVHNLRIWALSLNKTALSAHLAISPAVKPQDVLRLASRNIHARFNFFEMTLQIEEFIPNMEECTQCKEPEN